MYKLNVMVYQVLTTEQIKMLLEMYVAGEPVQKIQDELHISSFGTTYYHIHKNGIRTRGHPRTYTDRKQIEDMIRRFKNGEPLSIIGILYHMSPQTIRRIFDRENIPKEVFENEKGVCIRCGELVGRSNVRWCYWKRKVFICISCDRMIDRKRGREKKLEVIKAYGGCCECCGESNFEFLSIDHKDGDGSEHRKQLGLSTSKYLYNWLKKNGYPKDKFRLLCMNCNTSFGHYGYCPHEKALTHVCYNSAIRCVQMQQN